jgi:cyclophilin family peptidyl-prolyl cis-trans isomerase
MTWIVCLAFAVLQTLPATQTSSPEPAAGNPVVVVETSAGSITIELFKEQAPVSVQNFLQYVQDGFYPGTIFHRVVSGYVIQGGGYTADLSEKRTRPPIQNEADNKISNRRGPVAMARTRALRSATSQFYINLANNTSLDFTGYSPEEFGYAVFGRVIGGMEVVERIAATPTTDRGGMAGVPVTPVIIKGVMVKQ